MSKAEYYFSGKAAWLNTKPDKWGKFTLCFYPADAETRKAIKDLGLRNQLNEDDGKKSGVEGFFYRFKSPGGPFVLTDEAGEPITSMIGNGSDITMKLEVETFTSKDHGEVKRSNVLGIVVNKLIEFVPEKQEQKDVPAT